MNEELIKRLKDDSDFQSFQEIVVSKIGELSEIGDLKDLSNREAGETVRARATAIGILYEFLRPFVDFNEKRKPTAKQINVAKKKVGL